MDITESMQAIITAAGAGDHAKLSELLKAVKAAGADEAKGVEDVTAGLKSAKERVEAQRDALRLENEQKGKDLDGLRTELALKEAKIKAEAAGVQPEAVEKLAEERAQAKFESLQVAFTAKYDKRDAEATAAEKDREFLVGRYSDALLDHQLYRAAPEVDPIFWPVLRDNAKLFASPAQNGEAEWWRSKAPAFQILDPETKTVLPATTIGELVESQRAGEWKAFFPQKGAGGGMESQGSGRSGSALPDNATSTDYFAAVIAEP